MTLAFHLLLHLEWGTSPGGTNCKLSFNLLVPLSDVKQLLRKELITVITPAPVLQLVDDAAIAGDQNPKVQLESNLNLMIENNFAAMEVKMPLSLKRRLSKKAIYSSKTLAKYASEL